MRFGSEKKALAFQNCRCSPCISKYRYRFLSSEMQCCIHLLCSSPSCHLLRMSLTVCMSVRQLHWVIRIFISGQYSGRRKVVMSVPFPICRLRFTTRFLRRMFLTPFSFPCNGFLSQINACQISSLLKKKKRKKDQKKRKKKKKANLTAK